MASKATVTYVFRRPRFPVICAVDGGLIAARSPASFQRQITRLDPPVGRVFQMVDATGEGWAFHTEWTVVSPLTLKKRWTKAEIIRLFNESEAARRRGQVYPETSLRSKSLQRIIAEIAGLAARSSRITRFTPPRGQSGSRELWSPLRRGG